MTDRSDPLVDLLADHDAGLSVDPSVLNDPRARTVLDALAATRAELAAVPPVPVPPGFAARWNVALTETPTPRVDRSGTPSSPIGHGRRPPEDEPDGTATAAHAASPRREGPADGGGPRGRLTGPADHHGRGAGGSPAAEPSEPSHRGSAEHPTTGQRPEPPSHGPRPPGGSTRRPGPGLSRPRPGRTRRPRPAVVAGLVLAAVLVVAGVVSVRRAPPTVTAAQLGGIARAAVGVQEAGPLSDPIRREECLRTVAPPGLAPDAPLAGGREVVFEGRPAVILLLITGKLATFRVVVVDPACGAGGGTLLADTLVGQ